MGLLAATIGGGAKAAGEMADATLAERLQMRVEGRRTKQRVAERTEERGYKADLLKTSQERSDAQLQEQRAYDEDQTKKKEFAATGKAAVKGSFAAQEKAAARKATERKEERGQWKPVDEIINYDEYGKPITRKVLINTVTGEKLSGGEPDITAPQMDETEAKALAEDMASNIATLTGLDSTDFAKWGGKRAFISSTTRRLMDGEAPEDIMGSPSESAGGATEQGLREALKGAGFSGDKIELEVKAAYDSRQLKRADAKPGAKTARPEMKRGTIQRSPQSSVVEHPIEPPGKPRLLQSAPQYPQAAQAAGAYGKVAEREKPKAERMKKEKLESEKTMRMAKQKAKASKYDVSTIVGDWVIGSGAKDQINARLKYWDTITQKEKTSLKGKLERLSVEGRGGQKTWAKAKLREIKQREMRKGTIQR